MSITVPYVSSFGATPRARIRANTSSAVTRRPKTSSSTPSGRCDRNCSSCCSDCC